MRTIITVAATLIALPAVAAEPPKLVLKDHRFTPETVTVPANARMQIVVSNQDATPEEFDSGDLRVEKLIAPRNTVAISIGPLRPGRYAFEGEFHAATAKGVVIAEAR